MEALWGRAISYERGTPVPAHEVDEFWDSLPIPAKVVLNVRTSANLTEAELETQGYLAHKKQRPPGTLQWDHA